MEAKAGYHHGDLRRALLGAALSLLGERDGPELSLRQVARRAGVSSAAPYHHFSDKTALLAAVACEGFERLVSDLEVAAAGQRTLRAELEAMAEAYVAFATGNAAHYRVMFRPEVKGSTGAGALREAGDRAFGLLVERVARALPDEPFARHEELATAVWAALHGLSLLVIDGTLRQKFGEPNAVVATSCRAIVGMVLR